MWALGVTLHLLAFGYYPNGDFVPRPLLKDDFKAPPGSDPKIAIVLENALKVDTDERWSAAQLIDYLDFAAVNSSGQVKSHSIDPKQLSFFESKHRYNQFGGIGTFDKLK